MKFQDYIRQAKIEKREDGIRCSKKGQERSTDPDACSSNTRVAVATLHGHSSQCITAPVLWTSKTPTCFSIVAAVDDEDGDDSCDEFMTQFVYWLLR
jgi:hypothetical protein